MSALLLGRGAGEGTGLGGRGGVRPAEAACLDHVCAEVSQQRACKVASDHLPAILMVEVVVAVFYVIVFWVCVGGGQRGCPVCVQEGAAVQHTELCCLWFADLAGPSHSPGP